MLGNTTCLGLAEDAASATKSLPDTRFEVSGKLQLFQIATVKKTLFIDLTLCENGNCEENGSLTVVTC